MKLTKPVLRAIGGLILWCSLAMIGLLLFVMISDGVQGEGWNISGMISLAIMFGIVALAGLGIRSLGRDTQNDERAPSQQRAEPSNPDHKRWTDRA